MVIDRVMAEERIIVHQDAPPAGNLVSQAIAALEKLNRVGCPIPAQMEIVLTALVSYAAEIQERTYVPHS